MSEENQNGSGTNAQPESALDRYLKKQTSDGTAPAPSPEFVQDTAAATAPNLNLNLSAVPNTSYSPAGFWIRFVAALVDGMILQLVLYPVRFLLGVVFPIFWQSSQKQDSVGAVVASMLAVFVLSAVVSFFYFGWFYKNKGATPGKLLLNLRVLDAETGTYLNYQKTFLRESLAKLFLSGLFTLNIGYIIAAFTKDKRALHDMVCSTRVLKIRRT